MEEIWREYHAALLAFIRRQIADPARPGTLLKEMLAECCQLEFDHHGRLSD